MQIYTILNFKGGVGKTTSVQNIGASLAMKGNRVLLIDMDAQHNLTHSFGIDSPAQTVYEAMKHKKTLSPVPISENLHLAANSIEMISIDVELVNVMVKREYRLKECLAPIQDQYDFILIDCAPTLSLSTINALLVSENNRILIPVEPEYLSLKGFTVLRDSLKDFGLDIHKVFITKYDQRKSINKAVLQNLQLSFVDKLYKTYIRTNIALSGAQSLNQSIFEFAPTSNGAKDYDSLTNEILNDV